MKSAITAFIIGFSLLIAACQTDDTYRINGEHGAPNYQSDKFDPFNSGHSPG
jgi:hypothetical protein